MINKGARYQEAPVMNGLGLSSQQWSSQTLIRDQHQDGPGQFSDLHPPPSRAE